MSTLACSKEQNETTSKSQVSNVDEAVAEGIAKLPEHKQMANAAQAELTAQCMQRHAKELEARTAAVTGGVIPKDSAAAVAQSAADRAKHIADDMQAIALHTESPAHKKKTPVAQAIELKIHAQDQMSQEMRDSIHSRVFKAEEGSEASKLMSEAQKMLHEVLSARQAKRKAEGLPERDDPVMKEIKEAIAKKELARELMSREMKQKGRVDKDSPASKLMSEADRMLRHIAEVHGGKNLDTGPEKAIIESLARIALHEDNLPVPSEGAREAIADVNQMKEGEKKKIRDALAKLTHEEVEELPKKEQVKIALEKKAKAAELMSQEMKQKGRVDPKRYGDEAAILQSEADSILQPREE
ncbi:uncharacterized protein SPPG_06541 [Spizellomyces punctatus DAOM BR117]|uniref:Uncharacterized protein n=1 Tax=Spizellomyces punctatus (strain DAOM BR117) TaxID=645134 RepID=A0A0L0HB93_SPIPD|nr:uncharacterized protein SPPG_06541 [Spizellomyces punctatus DAOM BR117]KNC98134.1 hypothetical protein SPPG_06541 [Spizellomyces punctatus DAOM BR117]|eukprot:XP_016606174.1 hypothetical protein SPPG_06541 [Spizellomyces punctatus DAOM BR117]